MHLITNVIKYAAVFTFLVYPHAASANDADTEFNRNQQRQQQLDNRLIPDVDVRLGGDLPARAPFKLGAPESPCMAVQEITLNDAPDEFAFIVPTLVKQSGFIPGMCLGSKRLQHLQTLAQNIAIAKGFLTSQVYIAPQDLASGRLKLSVEPGRLGSIRYEENQGDAASVGRISAFANKFPNQSGDILNLRDLEQGLENLRRLPSVAADIRIEPGEMEGQSDIVVSWQQPRPLRFNINANDAGSKTTGKYQGSLALSLDNPLGLSDLFYASYSHDLGHKASYTDAEGITTGSGTRGYSLHYSVPVGHWLFAWNHNGYRYHEAVEGIHSNLDYNGKSHHSNISASRVVFRNARHKTTLGAKLWQQQSQKYYDNNEIEVQRRRTAGWAADIGHRAQLGWGSLYGSLAYKRGTGMRGSLKAPEEFNEENDIIPGTSRMKIIHATLGAAVPFQIGRHYFSYNGEIFAQWNKSPLVSQDHLAIGSRYTVRGFDGERNLSGERGWYGQNNLNWHYLPEHQAYLGLDYGRVSGLSTRGLPAQKLAGAVIGLKGAQALGGLLSYDVFIGKPLSKPAHFQTERTTYGFNLNYSF